MAVKEGAIVIVDCSTERPQSKEEVVIHETVKPARKRSKPSLESKGDGKPSLESKGDGAALVLEVRALKFEEGASEKRTYKKAFITRMTMRSFSSVVAQLTEAQAEVVKSMGFASFLKVNQKQIPGKFSKWLVECFDPYAVCFRLPYGQKFPIAAFDMYMTMGVPFGGSGVIKITKSSTDEEYDEVNDVTQIASLDWCQFVLDKLITSVRHYKESTAAKGVYFDGPLFFLMASSLIQQCSP
ncbi:hypothetical protein Cgig2_024707 [Carnegiea gigantea]|uniref:Uncharacterized protein n=1 Tax=Carnegiea gigantea TaxID=171969 RepID=A0A9Q1GGQ3_9CARY|nr:hypothetical protein Cgig2_024707 [Carnegiea gigantea]